MYVLEFILGGFFAGAFQFKYPISISNSQLTCSWAQFNPNVRETSDQRLMQISPCYGCNHDPLQIFWPRPRSKSSARSPQRLHLVVRLSFFPSNPSNINENELSSSGTTTEQNAFGHPGSSNSLDRDLATSKPSRWEYAKFREDALNSL